MMIEIRIAILLAHRGGEGLPEPHIDISTPGVDTEQDTMALLQALTEQAGAMPHIAADLDGQPWRSAEETLDAIQGFSLNVGGAGAFWLGGCGLVMGIEIVHTKEVLTNLLKGRTKRPLPVEALRNRL